MEIRRLKLNSSSHPRMVNTRTLEVFSLPSMKQRMTQDWNSTQSNKREPNSHSANFNSKRDTAFWNTSLVAASLIWPLQLTLLLVMASLQIENHYTISISKEMNIIKLLTQSERFLSFMILTNSSRFLDSEQDLILDADNSTHIASPSMVISLIQSVMDLMVFCKHTEKH